LGSRLTPGPRERRPVSPVSIKIAIAKRQICRSKLLMMALLLTISAILVWFGVAVPVANAIRAREDREFTRAMQLIRAHAVRNHHGGMRQNPGLAACSLQELQERFNIRESYEELPYS